LSLFNAKHVTNYTLVGVSDERPTERGNCFSVKDHDGSEWRILNFNYENLEALETLGLEWPVQCKSVSEHLAIIQDPRIGERWYSKRYCEVCCPESLLPVTQQQRHEREEMRGQRQTLGNCIQINFGVKAIFE
jgi:hypothetical protein